MRTAMAAVLGLVLVAPGSPGHAAEFTCAAGNVSCLVGAIHAANAAAGPSTVQLTDGVYTLTAVDNDTVGPNSLPSVTGSLTIRGTGAQQTVIERATTAPDSRLLHVAPTGALTLEDLTLRGGVANPVPSVDGFLVGFGGGILNDQGRLTLRRSRATGHRVVGGLAGYGGAIYNNGGVVLVTSSTIADNVVLGGFNGIGGGLATAGGALTITGSTIVDNRVNARSAAGGGGGHVSTFAALPRPPGSAVVDVVNTTIARNLVEGHGGVGGGVAAVSSEGRWTIASSTIAGNLVMAFGSNGGGVFAASPVTVRNTIVARNFTTSGVATGQDCSGAVTSLGHNLIEDPADCAIALQPQDRTGAPGLAIYTDDGTPGRGHWPLLPTSRAIDAGDTATCPATDQLDRPRRGACDIGAAEFFPDADPLAAFVTGFYRYALRREPAAVEVADWLGFLRAGPTLGRARVLTHAFFDGPEYRARHPLEPEGHVTALYRAILGRDPEVAGLNGWAQLLRRRVFFASDLFLGSPGISRDRARLP